MLSQYILIILWIGFMGLIQRISIRKEYVILSKRYERRVNPFFAFLVFFPVIWMAGNRTIYIGDTYLYRVMFSELPNSLLELFYNMQTVTKDKGFSVFGVLIKSIFGQNATIYLWIIAVIQGTILIVLYRKYSENYVFSIFLFIASADYLAWMFNGIRQFLAVVLTFCAFPLILKKKYVQALLIMLLAVSFHQSALIMIPFALICLGECWNWKTIVAFLLSIVAVSFVGSFTGLMSEVLSYTQYANSISQYIMDGDDGANPLRFLVYSVPAIIAFIKRKKIASYSNPVINYCANMSVLTSALYLISVFTSGIHWGRVPIYCSLYNYILLPWEIEVLFSKRKYLIYGICICLYLVYYLVQIHFSWGLI